MLESYQKDQQLYKVSRKEQKKLCLDLWTKIIKLRAGYKSELPPYRQGRQIGGTAVLHAHHILGKKSIRMLLELENGICLTQGEHFKIHSADYAEEMRFMIKKARGNDIYEKLYFINKSTESSDLKMIWYYLQEQLDKLQEKTPI